ncbi:fungal-specific transcription factor domain-containing protein, partial [Thamnocephalis sphaerospora]
VKCDGVRPACNKCIQLRINCTYQPRNQKRKQRQGYIEKLENRLMEMERLLKSQAEAAASNLVSHSPSPSVSATSSSSPPLSSAMLPPSSVHADPTHYPMAAGVNANAGANAVPNIAAIGNATFLPPVPDDLLKHLLSLFFTFCYPLGPVIHPPTFYQQLNARRISPLLLWTMCANAARYSDHPTLQANQLLASGEFFAQRAKEHLVASQSTPKVHGVQAVVFLGIFEYAQGRASTAWVYMGMATRMAQSLKLHRLDDPNITSRHPERDSEWVAAHGGSATWWTAWA